MVLPVQRKKLANDLADRVQEMIRADGLRPGDRLPSIATLASEYGVGAPTVREALKRLEIAGAVEIRHGSGVYVHQHDNTMLMASPLYQRVPSKKELIDLVEARATIEVMAAGLAAEHATGAQLDEMKRLLDNAHAHLTDDDVLNQTNMAFHREISRASGNSVFGQLLEVLTGVFAREQRIIIDIQDSRDDDHRQHVGIYEALRARSAALARERMTAHLAKVRRDLERWNPTERPLD